MESSWTSVATWMISITAPSLVSRSSGVPSTRLASDRSAGRKSFPRICWRWKFTSLMKGTSASSSSPMVAITPSRTSWTRRWIPAREGTELESSGCAAPWLMAGRTLTATSGAGNERIGPCARNGRRSQPAPVPGHSVEIGAAGGQQLELARHPLVMVDLRHGMLGVTHLERVEPLAREDRDQVVALEGSRVGQGRDAPRSPHQVERLPRVERGLGDEGRSVPAQEPREGLLQGAHHAAGEQRLRDVRATHRPATADRGHLGVLDLDSHGVQPFDHATGALLALETE